MSYSLYRIVSGNYLKMKKILFTVPLFLLLNCTPSTQKSEIVNNTDSLTTDKANELNSEDKKRVVEKIDFDFLTQCDSLELWTGGIQGGIKDDLKCCHLMGRCYKDKTYEIIIHQTKKIDLDYRTDEPNRTYKANIPFASYYVFEIPTKENLNPENEFDVFEYIYPSQIKIYKMINSNWYLVHSETVSTFTELGSLKLRTLKSEFDDFEIEI